MSDESGGPDSADGDAGSAGSVEGSSDAPDGGSDASTGEGGSDPPTEAVGFGDDESDDGSDDEGGLQKLDGGDPDPPETPDDEAYGPERPPDRPGKRPDERTRVQFSDEDDDPPPGHGVDATPPGEFVDGGPEDAAKPVTAADGAAATGTGTGTSTGTGTGTGTATGTGTGTGTGFPPEGGPGDPLVDEEPPQPPDDEEMPLADHIEEMVKRLAVVVIAVAIATGLAFPFAEPVLDAMWYGLLPPDTPAPHLYGPLEKILAEIKVASLAGILVALPVLVYEAYLFMRPGLYPRERRYFLSSVPTSLVLGAIGMAFAYFLVLPVLFDYFIFYSESGVDKLAFGLRVTFDLIVALLGAFALVFQIPLLIMLAILMGVTTRRWLESRRLYFWGGFLGLGFLMGGADLTGMAPIIIAATMIGLFEGTLALLRWTQRG